jgi:crossover junction endodeoxyribonuclease RuvC
MNQIQIHKPDVVAVESIIYVQSFQTAITLGSARGAVLLAAARHGLPVHEYAPRRVKQAVVGKGAAQKQQVAFMIRALLGLTVTPPPDAADAIAVGLTHLQSSGPLSRRAI